MLKDTHEKIIKHEEREKNPAWMGKTEVDKAHDLMYVCVSVLMKADELRNKHPDLGAHFKERFTNVCKWYMENVSRSYVVIVDCLIKDTLKVDNKKLNCIMAIAMFSSKFGEYIERNDMMEVGK